MKRLYFFALVMLAFFMANAQVTVKGYVFDNENLKLSGAIVWLDGQKTATDDMGFFKFKNIHRNRDVELKVSFTGFETFSKQFRFSKDTVLTVKLQPSAQELDEIVVSAVRAPQNAPFAQTTLTSEDIEEHNTGQDMPYLLKLTPSLTFSSDGGVGIGYTNMTIRGTDLSRINVTINGVPLNDPESHGVWWVDVPDIASSARSIQIQRGVGTSTNGAGAFGASLNINTAELHRKAYAGIYNSYGSFNSYRNTVKFGTGLINNHFIFEGRLSRMHTDGYIDRAWANLKSFQFSAGYVNDKTSVIALISSGLEETYQAWYGVPKDSLKTNRTFNPYTYDNQIDHYGQTHFQFLVNHKFSDKLLFNTTLFYVKGSGYYEQYKDAESYEDYGLQPIILQNDTIDKTDLIRRKWLTNDFYGANLNFTIKPVSNVNIQTGGSWSNYLGDHFGRIIWMQYAGTTPIRYQWYFNDGIKNDANVYAKTMSKFGNFDIFIDLQYRLINYIINGIDDDLSQLSEKHHYRFFNPKAGFTYEISKKHSVYASFAVAHREPKRSDFTDAPSDKKPNPETLYDYEAGYNFKSVRASAQVNFYYMDYYDQLILTGEINDVGAPIVTNVSRSYRRGVELILGTKITDFLNWNANLTLSQNKILNFTEYVDNWDYWDDPDNNPLQITHYLGTTDIAFSPSIIAASSIEFKPFKFTSISLNSKYVGRQYIDNTSSEERSLDPYFVNDIVINAEFTGKYIKKATIGLNINNILNEQYETFAWVYSYYYGGKRYAMDGYFPQAGRNFMLSLKLDF